MSTEPSGKFSLEIPPVPRGIDAWASLAGGLCMVALVATRHLRPRTPLLAIGGWLLGRGAMGVVEELRRFSEALPSPAAPQTEILPPEDPLDEANWESFPASDPPAMSRPRRTSNGVHP